MKTIYIADDGKQFDNYNECMHYEKLQKYSEKGLGGIHVWDINAEEMELTVDNAEVIVDLIYYVRCDTKKAIDFLYYIYDETCNNDFGVVDFKPNVLYKWNNDFGEFENYDEQILKEIHTWKKLGLSVEVYAHEGIYE